MAQTTSLSWAAILCWRSKSCPGCEPFLTTKSRSARCSKPLRSLHFRAKSESVSSNSTTQESPPVTCRARGSPNGPLANTRAMRCGWMRSSQTLPCLMAAWFSSLTGFLNMELFAIGVGGDRRGWRGTSQTVFQLDGDQPVQVIKELSDLRLQFTYPRACASSDLLEQTLRL